ncbi:hypothetical protein [Fictibacillus terranigra]|uniref:Peptide/nickel transport system permease protein n=1 Tax=Fictibacillus terranigra TaxID=3058424 RepID=A0ABT8E307_9BACL|nr:hypothetical protein [Fictibacillus sp. CENA-BCM004]MDN4072282.1 hypothetical protein [Fictibacillus sp. CENA-BCM004]
MAILRKMLIQFLLTVVSIVLISGLPDLFLTKNVSSYWEKIKDVSVSLLHPGHLQYIPFKQPRPLFPDFLDPYFYSITILLTAFLLAFFLAQVLAWMTMTLPERVRAVIKNLLTLLESLPDLLVFALVQMFIVFFYKQTSILLSDVASLGEQRIYVIPIMCLMILPFIYFYKMMVLLSEEESKKPYFEFSRAKGLRRTYVLLFHVTRNTYETLFHFSKTVLWFMISNLLLVEWIFNIDGITYYLYSDFRAEIMAVILVFLAIPFFVFFGFLEFLLSIRLRREAGA